MNEAPAAPAALAARERPAATGAGDSGALILGGGLAGLAAGYALGRAGQAALLLEAAPQVGGLARTIQAEGFRFDLGGHRFVSADSSLLALVQEMLAGELVEVKRHSTIWRGGRHFDYPLRLGQALSGVGPLAAGRMLGSYARARLAALTASPPPASLEEWVVSRFGRELFQRFFREYSEKVWGLSCAQVDAELAAKRIGALSLGRAMARALGRGKNGPGPEDSFFYPRLGMGRLGERLAQEMTARGGRIWTGCPVREVHHGGGRVLGVSLGPGAPQTQLSGEQLISTLPLTTLIESLRPLPPRQVREAAEGLRFRDLVVAALFLDRPPLTRQTWIYLPEASTPFGRLHEPTNWSPAMAPPGQTLLVAEYFCFAGDELWRRPDQEILELTARHLAGLGLGPLGRVLGGKVVRVPQAYPIPGVGHQRPYALLRQYLAGLANLRLAGRSGGFLYLNMDEALAQGLAAAAGAAADMAGGAA